MVVVWGELLHPRGQGYWGWSKITHWSGVEYWVPRRSWGRVIMDWGGVGGM